MRSMTAAAKDRPMIVIPDDISGSYAQSHHLSRLEAIGEVRLFPDRPASPAELAERLQGADAAISFRPAFTRFTADVLSACPDLRLLSISGTGLGDVDLGAATAGGIKVANVPGPSNRAVAEHAVALALDVARSISQQDRAVRAGEWSSPQGIELGGRTLGLVGFGGIARELAGIARAFGMRVLAWSKTNDPQRAADHGVEAVDLDVLLASSDVVSLHAALNAETSGLVDAQFLRRMKRGAMLINTARGGVVDHAALVDALRSGHLRGAGLDVFHTEPLPAGDALRELPNVVMTAVNAWNTSDSSDRMIGISIDNVVGFFAGSPLNVRN
jgi:D-3-phosphoglycerate dehydrogenase